MRGLRRYFQFGRHSIQQASILLVLTSLLSNALGLIRNLIFYRLIPRAQLDVYNSSFRLSDFVYNILVFGAISSALVPVVSSLLHNKEEDEAYCLINQLISWSSVAFLVLGIIFYAVMPLIAHLIVPGYLGQPAKLAEFIHLSRIMLLQPLIFSVSFIIGSLLNSYRRFGSYALAPVIYNVAIIVGGLLAPRFGVIAITISVIIGAALHFVIQYREVLATGYRLQINFSFDERIKEVIRLMIPRSLAQGFAQVVPAVYANLSSAPGREGWFSIFTGINDIQTAPTVVVANSLATASFPALTASVQSEDHEELRRLVTKLFRTTFFALIPVVAMGLILRAQLVRLYVGIGHQYTWQQTDQGIALLTWFLIGMIPAASIVLLARVFYARKDSRTPLLISAIGNGLAIFTAIFMVTRLHSDVASFGEAEALSSILQCVLYGILLQTRGYIRLPLIEVGKYALTYLVGAALLVWTTWASLQAVAELYARLGHPYTNKILGLFIQTAIAAAIGGLTYLGYSSLKSKEELKWLRKRAFSNAK